MRTGAVLLVSLVDGNEVLGTPPSSSPVTALSWNHDGSRLAYGCANGAAGVMSFD